MEEEADFPVRDRRAFQGWNQKSGLYQPLPVSIRCLLPQEEGPPLPARPSSRPPRKTNPSELRPASRVAMALMAIRPVPVVPAGP